MEEIKQYRAIIQDSKHNESIMRYYSEVCKKTSNKNLFSVVFPYNNVFMLSYVLSEITKDETKYYFGIEKAETEIKQYMDGFIVGYNKLIERVKMFQNSYQNDVFDVVVSFDYDNKPYFIDENNTITLIPQMDFYGEKVGKLYCAWCIILESQSYFDPLFKEYYEPKQENNFLSTSLKDNHVYRLNSIYEYLRNERKYFDCSLNIWLYWFGKKPLEKKPDKIKWNGADYLLTSLIDQLCGTAGEKFVKVAFIYKKKYQNSKYKENESKDFHKKINEYMFYGIGKEE